jgi:hypothetical protein
MATHPIERPRSVNETLAFSNPEQAQEFVERVQEKSQQKERVQNRDERKIIKEELVKEFAKAGQAISGIDKPWRHTPIEHTQAQELVNIAFTKDLKTALRRARHNQQFPRNLDLFHDVLTTELYEAIRQNHMNKQPIRGRTVLVAMIVIVILIGIVVLFTL